jgi:2-polyprenyl-3-methyl-5-hydroxy-6-metoxy-1,4-benzoquinol methylase
MTQRVPTAPPEDAAPMAPHTGAGAAPPAPAEATAEAEGAEQTGQQEAFVGRLFESGLGALDLLAISLGLQLGLYKALADGGPATPAEVAARTGIHERYAREWLEQQAVGDVLEVVADPGSPEGRRYRLPAGRAVVLLGEENLFYLAPVARMIDGMGALMPRLLAAYRTGGGLTLAEMGPEGVALQAALNRPAYVNLLGQHWLPAIPDVHARLQASPPAHVADVGCGAGWSSIAIARAYPGVTVCGFDADPASIALARRNAAASGVADRVRFFLFDAADPVPPGLGGRFDLVAAFEVIHDVARPVEVLETMRQLATPGGTVLVMDERTGEAFAAPGSPVDRLFHSISLFVCLPWGMAGDTPERPSAATGTVMRPATLRRYAEAAGFRAVEVLPIEHDLYRFYRLVA